MSGRAWNDVVSDPSPEAMLLEGAIDTVAALKLLRLGASANLPFRDASGVIESAIEQLEYAISAAVDARKAA